MEQLASQWVRGRVSRGELRPHSGDVELSHLRRLVALHGERPPGDLNRATILAYQQAIAHLKPRTRRSAMSSVSRFCRWLVQEGHLNADPCVGLDRVRVGKRVPRALTAAQARKVVEAADTAALSVIVRLMLGCGLRCCEVSALDVDDFDPVERTLAVRGGKGGNERVLPVPAHVAETLDRYISDRVDGPLVAAPARLSAQRISKQVAALMTRAGVHTPGDGRTAHALRHTAASDVLEACHDLRVVQQMLGHTSLATTEIYLRVANLGQMREAMEGRMYQQVS